MSSRTKLAMVGSAAAATSPVVTPVSSELTSAPEPPATASLMASVADRLKMTTWIATTASNKRERELHEERAHELSRVLADHGLQRRGQEHGEDDDAGQRRHLAVVGAEPGGPDVHRRGRHEHVADLAQQPFGAARHPLADPVEDRLEARGRDGAPDAPDLADRG